MDGVLVITGQRSGAGHLFALMRNLTEVAPRDDLLRGSITDAGGLIGLAEFEASASHRRVLALRAVSTIAPEIVERDILGRHGMRAVFVVRRQIDAYVSLAMATALGVWRDRDTSGVRVKLDFDHFAGWLEAEERWYAHWQSWLEKRSFPTPILRYETHLSVAPDSVLRRFASAAAQVGISLKVPNTLPFAGLTRQDSRRAVAFKVRNWPEFSRALIGRGIEKRAFGYPI
jgi:LPS sulfotransferase NodH